MNTTDYNSMDTLTRQPRVPRCQRTRASSITTKPLHIIVEEVEPSLNTSIERKVKRRHCNLSDSDIQIARDFVGLDDDDDAFREDRLLLVPPQSARLGPAPSPDLFQVKLSDEESYTFPSPPSSIKSRRFSLSSDEDFFGLPSPKFNPRRAGIHSLMSLSRPSQPMQPSPFTSEESSSDSESDTDSDSEWYQHELSKILTVHAPSAPTQMARPDSIFIPADKRLSRPSGQLDPAFPNKRQSRQFHIPSYPPPPVPAIPAPLRPIVHLVPSSPSSFLSFSDSPSRPPPRSSVPTDFDFELEDDSSLFSFSAYQGDGGSPLDDAEFDIDLDYQMMLPLSLPGTPIDLEADFASGLEELRARSATGVACPSPLPSVPEQAEPISDFSSPSVPLVALPRSPSRDSWASFYVSEPSSSPLPTVASFAQPPTPPPKFTIEDEMRVLKSKWSTSTLGSIREEHEQRTSSRLRIFSPTKHQRTLSKVHSKASATPMLPMSFISSSPSKKQPQKAQAAVARAAAGHKKKRESMDIMHTGVRKRESCSTVSDAGTNVSASSNGLRRKPIPLELLLRVQ